MLNHAPEDYTCPFCRLVSGLDTQRCVQADIVYRGDGTTAFVAPKWWEGNRGHVLVVPDRHAENIYEVAAEDLGQVYATAQRIASAMREAYGCDGISTRQHNEPAGDQDVWHFHVHVFPRYEGDDLYLNHRRTRWVDAGERAPYVERLRASLEAAGERA